ncbi:MAG: hypothetical protein ACLRVB_09245, partial [Blautia sp.]
EKDSMYELSAKNDRLTLNSGRGVSSVREMKIRKYAFSVISRRELLTLIPGRSLKISRNSSARS